MYPAVLQCRHVSLKTLMITVLVLLSPGAIRAQTRDRVSLEDVESHVYKKSGDAELKVYVFKPGDWQATDRRPAIVFYFGGGWRNGSPTQFVPQSKYLASRGMVALCADYRVYSRNQAQVTDCVADAKSAFRWVRGHAAELGIDPDRMAAGGGSAGGHLAAAVATLDAFDDSADDASIVCRPNALALFNPAVDLTALDDNVKQRNELRERLGSTAEELSPGKHIIPGIAPTIIFHGQADTTVPYAQVEQFAAKMQQCGNRCELVGYGGAVHGFFNYGRGDGKAYRDTLRRLDEFLVSLGYLSGPPTITPDK